MTHFIKICGITSKEDAKMVETEGADALGFILHEESARFIEIDKAVSIAESIKSDLDIFLVFVNRDQEFVKEFKVYLSDLNKSNNHDKKNWSKLLSYIIYGSANELFYDGKNIYITWGWELINENSKSLIPKFISSNNILDEQITIPTNEKNYSHQIKTETNLNETHKITFLDRCHNFVRKNWWITPSLTLIIFLLLILGF